MAVIPKLPGTAAGIRTPVAEGKSFRRTAVVRPRRIPQAELHGGVPLRRTSLFSGGEAYIVPRGEKREACVPHFQYSIRLKHIFDSGNCTKKARRILHLRADLRIKNAELYICVRICGYSVRFYALEVRLWARASDMMRRTKPFTLSPVCAATSFISAFCPFGRTRSMRS